MPGKHSRRLPTALVVAVAALALAACGDQYPNSTFTHLTDLNTATDALWNRLLLFGTIVFVFVEVLLLVTIFKFRKRPDSPEPKQVHGNAVLEITWTAIPALILVLIAVPTVKTIFKTQAKAAAGSLQVEVIGHQWWWEFRYPELGVTTANELYIPAGRTVNFALKTKDVLHSFWTPNLGGKRDLISNKTNYLWYTPNAEIADQVFNGFCVEYCGSSHANMRFRVYTVSEGDFGKWIDHQKTAGLGSPMPAATPVGAAAMPGMANMAGMKNGAKVASATPAMNMAADSGYVFPVAKIPAHAIPSTPLPSGEREVKFDDSLLPQGNVAAGREILTNMANMGKAPCLTCHIIKGEMTMMGLTDDAASGPNLTHFGTRHTIAGGIYAADAKTLARWLKNARMMKPGSIMPTLGTGELDPQTGKKLAAGLDDRQIADIVAYLMALK
jgi:cytochrome c oxidase subunit 2